ncbi:MAG: UDP-N-acetylmuramoyl-L-alanyl-D-glutamate--2,6-diaminopimelate ligase [Actinomycetota bacterium]|nr:UDP-N-acetylmuramoyl-L-alanyl-D-glutamate--2,6-diaminopimelate ligase [Actinomycetota bacterium]
MASLPRPRTQPVRLADIVARLGLLGDGVDVPVTGITLDSRGILPGDVYAALPGRSAHGASFAAAAVAAGAVAVITDVDGSVACAGLGVPVLVVEDPRRLLGRVASRVYGDPAERLHSYGITGTNGKTTVASMVTSGLRAAGRVSGLIGTVGVRIGDTDYAGTRTTPESTDLHAILAAMVDEGVSSVVMEVSSIAIAEHRVDGLVFDIAAFTNLTQDHLDYHRTMADYFEAKASLFSADRTRLGIIGIDDEWGRALADRCPVPFETWSLSSPVADWTVQRSATGWLVTEPGGLRTPIEMPLPGAFNVANALCAFAVLRRAGVDPLVASEGIAAAAVPGRMQVVGSVGGVTGIVDYAHSPDAIERVLLAARDLSIGRVIAVLGAGGGRDRGKRPLMGSVAAGLADVIVITDDNPRSEEPGEIRAAIMAGIDSTDGRRRAEVHDEGDRGRAISVAVGMAEPGDLVVVLGKGHEQGQEVAGVVTPFDDASVLVSALRRREQA